MDESPLHRHLQDLHEELTDGVELDDATRELLLTVLDDLRSLLAQSKPAAPEEHASLAARLRETTWHLEETHPALTTAVGQVIDVLSRPFR